MINLSTVECFIQGVVKKTSRERGVDFWRMPLAGSVEADNLLFETLKDLVAADHLMPKDLLAEAKSVVAYFIPFTKAVAEDNRKAHPRASRLWATAYLETNELIAHINKEVSIYLGEEGYKTAVTPATHNFDEKRLISWWSHKHIAYIAGLGTFGLNQLLITSSGCCGRFGSFVTDAPIVDDRNNNTILENCLQKRGKECGRCLERCPVGALHLGGSFDRHRCYSQLLENDRFFMDLPLVDVCGQCSCGLPCSHKVS